MGIYYGECRRLVALSESGERFVFVYLRCVGACVLGGPESPDLAVCGYYTAFTSFISGGKRVSLACPLRMVKLLLRLSFNPSPCDALEGIGDGEIACDPAVTGILSRSTTWS